MQNCMNLIVLLKALKKEIKILIIKILDFKE
jgi:hypothetical protein